MSAPAGWWRRWRSSVWHFVSDSDIEFHPLDGYCTAYTICGRHEFATDNSRYTPFTGPGRPSHICKRCAEAIAKEAEK